MPLEFDSSGRVIVPKGILKENLNDPNFIQVKLREGFNDFIFDYFTYQQFKNAFNIKGQAFFTDSNYLKRWEEGNQEFFHRWLMKNEIEKFCKENNLTEIEVEVHHKNFNHWDNRRCNLECRKKSEHRKAHQFERDWEIYRKKMSQFWRKNRSEEYYKKVFKHYWNFKNKKGIKV